MSAPSRIQDEKSCLRHPQLKLGSSTFASLWAQDDTSLRYTRSNVGIGTAAPAAKLDVSGEVKFGNTSSTCDFANEGQQRYNSSSKMMEFCNGVAWTSMSSGSGAALGAWVPKSVDTVYQAATDGFVLVYFGNTLNEYNRVAGITDVSNTPTTIRIEAFTANYGGWLSNFTMPVRKNDYWKASHFAGTAPVTVYWIPLGN